MKTPTFLFLLLAVSLLAGCQPGPKPSSEYMVLDKIVYVDDFPAHFTAKQGDSLDLGLFGVLDMSIQDSILIATTPDPVGMWSFFSLPDYQYRGKYLHEGRGPYEFLSTH